MALTLKCDNLCILNVSLVLLILVNIFTYMFIFYPKDNNVPSRLSP